MRVIEGGNTIVDVRVKAEVADDRITEDYYASLPQIRLNPDPNNRQKAPATPTEVILDDGDVATIVAFAIRHPRPNMRQAVLAAIRNHPDSFREIFQFGLEAPETFGEIRAIVAAALDKQRPMPQTATVATPLLPKMPLPAHLKNRERRE